MSGAAPVRHRLAREMAAEGCSLDEIATEFGEPIARVAAILGVPVSKRSAPFAHTWETDAVIRESYGKEPAAGIAARLGMSLNALRVRAKRLGLVNVANRVAALRVTLSRLHADPEFAARHAERMRRLHADPEFAARNSERMRRLNADPEFRARLGRLPRAILPGEAARYRALRAEHGKAEALRRVLAERGR